MFAVLTVLALWQALSKKSSLLTLTREGFSFQTPLASHTYRWDDIDSFGYGTMNRRDAVYFKFASTYTGNKPLLAGASKYIAKGFEMYLPDTYGMPSLALARLMTDWHARSGGAHPSVTATEVPLG